MYVRKLRRVELAYLFIRVIGSSLFKTTLWKLVIRLKTDIALKLMALQ